MLRTKRVTPTRLAQWDDSAANPLQEFRRQFMDWSLAIGLSPETAKLRGVALRYFIRWCHRAGIARPEEITLASLERYQGHLAAVLKANGRPLADATKATRINPLRAFCKWLKRAGLVQDDPSESLMLPRQPRSLPCRVPSVDEVKRMLRQPNSHLPSGVRDRAILETLYATGLRRMELARLTMADVNLGALSVFVRKGKGGRDRVVPLSPRAARWIGRYLRRVRPRLLAPVPDDALFLTDFGEAFERNRLGDMVRKYVVRAGFPAPGSCHLFRHACATHMLENGADIRFIQELLGHSALSTTQLYTRVSISGLREVHARTHPGFAAG